MGILDDFRKHFQALGKTEPVKYNLRSALPLVFAKKDTLVFGEFEVHKSGNKYLFKSSKFSWLVTLKADDLSLGLTVDGENVHLTSAEFIPVTDALRSTPEAVLKATASTMLTIGRRVAKRLAEEKKATAAAEHTTLDYANAITQAFRNRLINLGSGLHLQYRTKAKLTGKNKLTGQDSKYLGQNDYVIKFEYILNDEDTGLDFTMLVGVDQITGVFSIMRVRCVAQSDSGIQYKNSAFDQHHMLAGEPNEVPQSLSDMLVPADGEMHRAALTLFRKSRQHLGQEELAAPPAQPGQPLQIGHNPDGQPEPAGADSADYAYAVLRGLKNQRLEIDDGTYATVKTVSNLPKTDGDCILKFELDTDIEDAPKGLEMHLYLAADRMVGGAMIRNIRLWTPDPRFRDSDKRISIQLEPDVEEAVHDLREQICGGPVGRSIIDALFRLRTHVGSDAPDAPVPEDSYDIDAMLRNAGAPEPDEKPEDRPQLDHKPSDEVDPDAFLRELGLL